MSDSHAYVSFPPLLICSAGNDGAMVDLHTALKALDAIHDKLVTLDNEIKKCRAEYNLHKHLNVTSGITNSVEQGKRATQIVDLEDKLSTDTQVFKDRWTKVESTFLRPFLREFKRDGINRATLLSICGSNVTLWTDTNKFIGWFSSLLRKITNLAMKHFPDVTLHSVDCADAYSRALDIILSGRPHTAFIKSDPCPIIIEDEVASPVANHPISEDPIPTRVLRSSSPIVTDNSKNKDVVRKSLKAAKKLAKESKKRKERSGKDEETEKNEPQKKRQRTSSKSDAKVPKPPLPNVSEMEEVDMDTICAFLRSPWCAPKHGPPSRAVNDIIKAMFAKASFKSTDLPVDALAVYFRIKYDKAMMTAQCTDLGIAIPSNPNCSKLGMLLAERLHTELNAGLVDTIPEAPVTEKHVHNCLVNYSIRTIHPYGSSPFFDFITPSGNVADNFLIYVRQDPEAPTSLYHPIQVDFAAFWQQFISGAKDSQSVNSLVDDTLATFARNEPMMETLGNTVFSPKSILNTKVMDWFKKDVRAFPNNLSCIPVTLLGSQLHDSPMLPLEIGDGENPEHVFLNRLFLLVSRKHMCQNSGGCTDETCAFQRLIFTMATALSLKAFSLKDNNCVQVMETTGIVPHVSLDDSEDYKVFLPREEDFSRHFTNKNEFQKDTGDSSSPLLCPLRCGATFNTLETFLFHIGKGLDEDCFHVAPGCLRGDSDIQNSVAYNFRLIFTVTLLKVVINFYKALQDTLLRTAGSDFLEHVKRIFPHMSREDLQCFIFMVHIAFFTKKEASQETSMSNEMNGFTCLTTCSGLFL